MDADKLLTDLRKLTDYSLTNPKFDGYGGYTWRTLVEALGERFRALDDHLSGGGRPPEAWREGPDAPELDEDDTYPWCYLCDKVFGRGRDRERDEHLRTAHTAEPLGGPVPGVNGSHLPEVEL
jgi:hypothetical protein